MPDDNEQSTAMSTIPTPPPEAIEPSLWEKTPKGDFVRVDGVPIRVYCDGSDGWWRVQHRGVNMTDQFPSAEAAMRSGLVKTLLGAPVVHVEMKPQEMFPENEDGSMEQGLNLADKEPENRRNPWMYRITGELTIGEVRKLFIPTPHESLKKILNFVDNSFGDAYATKIGIGIPVIVPPKPRPRSLLVDKAIRKLMEQFDLIPREVAEHAVAVEKAKGETLVKIAKYEGRMEMAQDVRKEAEKILGGLMPHVDAEGREGKDFRGNRVVAIWSDPASPTPTEEPEF